METTERQYQMMKLLCRNRHMTITELAREFDVSDRTIRRDVESLSAHEPLYTEQGRYNGGVFVADGYYFDKDYFTDSEKNILGKIITFAQNKTVCALSEDEINALKRMLCNYSKPCAASYKK